MTASDIKSRKEHVLERLQKLILLALPGAESELDLPEKPSGSGFLDLSFNGRGIVIEYRKGRGFGITSDSEITGFTGPDEVYEDVAEAAERAIHLLRTGSRTSPPLSAQLHELRQAVARATGRDVPVTQEELAALLDVTQAAVSRLERRSVSNTSTLRRVVEALGGRLELAAVLQNGQRIVIEQS